MKKMFKKCTKCGAVMYQKKSDKNWHCGRCGLEIESDPEIIIDSRFKRFIDWLR